MRRVGVVGAGAWGTTIANLLAGNGAEVALWAYEADVVESIRARHENALYLPGVRLHSSLRVTSKLEDAVADADAVISVSPSQHVRRVMGEAAAALRDDAVVVSASKGIETRTRSTMAEVLADVLAPPNLERMAFLSGPSFALEVARGQPTAVVVASASESVALKVQRLFQNERFRVYTNPDVRGVELGGALKNVMAIAAGMTVGLELGHNALAAMITRGLAEMSRLGVALGADARTFSGLAGMGDLILTCTGHLSRNRRVGVELGKGRPLEEILAGMTDVAEGVETARAAHALAAERATEMPIVAAVHAVLFEGRHTGDIVDMLMLREAKSELQ